MPSCVIRFCRNHERKINKSQGITYHSFPSNESRRRRWVNIVRKQRKENGWQSNKWSKICSIHFKEKDKYRSSKGMTLLKKSALPTLEGHLQDEPTSEPFTSATPALKSQVLSTPELTANHGTTDTSSLSQDDSTDLQEQSSCENYTCNQCLVVITGFRYTCVQCANVDLCGACEAKTAHKEHFVLRVPPGKDPEEVDLVIDMIREKIQAIESELEKNESIRKDCDLLIVKEESSCDEDGDEDDHGEVPNIEQNLEIKLECDFPMGDSEQNAQTETSSLYEHPLETSQLNINKLHEQASRLKGNVYARHIPTLREGVTIKPYGVSSTPSSSSVPMEYAFGRPISIKIEKVNDTINKVITVDETVRASLKRQNVSRRNETEDTNSDAADRMKKN